MDVLKICEEGHVARLREWVASAESDLDQTGPDGETALHIACGRGFMRCVRILVAAGANMNVQNAFGQTPLHIAVTEGHTHVAVLLLHSGAHGDAQNAV